MLLALLLSFLVSARAHSKSRRTRSRTAKYAPFGRILKLVLGLQMLVEDIPQFVIGALVRSERGNLDPYLVFTWTTSGFNFFLNLLDMIEIEDDGDMSSDDGAIDENETSRGGHDHERGSRTVHLF